MDKGQEKTEYLSDRFRLALTTTTHSRSKIFENHCHSLFEMITVLEGGIRVIMESGEYLVGANGVIFIPPFAYHTVFTSEAGKYSRITAHFDSVAIPEPILSDFVSATKLNPVTEGPSVVYAVNSLKTILQSGNNRYFEPLLHSVMTQLFYDVVCLSPETRSQGPVSEMDEVVSSIIKYIGENIESKITLDSIAGRVFLSKSTVCHLFKSKMKISIKQYVLQKKISYATALIQQGVPTGEAAKRIGYLNYANFYTAYKNLTGKSPAEIKPKENT